MNEQWKDIPCFEGRYQVSNLGRVRHSVFKRVLKSDSGNQPCVSIVINGHPKVFEIRHLMAYAFLGADPASSVKPKIVHKDGDLSNIHLDNLELADYSNQDGEIWKDINGFEGVYQVSNLGRVKRLEHLDEYIRKDTGCVCRRKVGEKILRPTLTSEYYEVNLVYKDLSKYCRIHRLVAEAFIDNPDDLPCINHKDGNKMNNKLENLEWCTHQYNIHHALVSGLRHDPEKGIYRKPVNIVCNQTCERFNSIKEAADKLGLRYHYLSDCLSRNKPCHGYTFTRL